MRKKLAFILVFPIIFTLLPAVLYAADLELNGSIFLLINPDEESAPSPIENSRSGFATRTLQTLFFLSVA